MATWECRKCTAAYAPGAPACPQCGTNDPIEEIEQLRREREEMPKITVHGGPSNADAEDPQTGDGVEVGETTDTAAEQTEQTEEPPATTPDAKPKPAAARKPTTK